VYEGLTYRLNLTFPPEYPYRPPTIKFDTPCYHPSTSVRSYQVPWDVRRQALGPPAKSQSHACQIRC
jgi:ubiquitin-protein ligase